MGAGPPCPASKRRRNRGVRLAKERQREAGVSVRRKRLRKNLRTDSGRIGPVPPRLGRVVCLKWRSAGAFAVLKVSVASVRVGSETDGRLVADGSMALIVLPVPPAITPRLADRLLWTCHERYARLETVLCGETTSSTFRCLLKLF